MRNNNELKIKNKNKKKNNNKIRKKLKSLDENFSSPRLFSFLYIH